MAQLISQTLDAFTRLLYKQTILILMLLFCVGISIALSNMWRLSSNLIKSQALQNSALYAQAIKEARTLYNDQAVDRLASVHSIIVTDDYLTKKGAIPVPATFLIELGLRLSEKNNGMSVRLYSEYPFPYRPAVEGKS
jgi:adenylate cyclase